jgi:hypothetical protein
MRDIRASVEVRALIGADSLRELRGKAFAHYECWQCGRQGRTAEPTSVIVLAYRFSAWSNSRTPPAQARTSSSSTPPR